MASHKRPPGTLEMPPPNLQPSESALLTDTPSPTGDPFNNTNWGSNNVQNDVLQTGDELPDIPDKPPIPNALPITIPGITPLPLLPMTVLSIVMLGEFLSANVSAPWVLFMVKSFNISDDEAVVGYWTGILCSMFFITQFVTSLLWATVAEKYGQRTVLFVSLLGMAISCTVFGTSKTFSEALLTRLLQGVFAGAVGVARGSVGSIVDSTNEGRAYSILGFSWGMGGVAGAIVGGAFESPAEHYPSLFGNVQLFKDYPYLLPCLIASSVTFAGAILSLGLSRDGGVREGAIRLDPDKEVQPLSPLLEEEEATPLPTPISAARPLAQLRHKVSRKLSGVFAHRVFDARRRPSGASGVGQSSLMSPVTSTPAVAMSRTRTQSTSTPAVGMSKTRTMSRTSRANGSAYGYGTPSRPVGSVDTRRGSLASTIRRRRRDTNDVLTTENDEVPSNFAQRLLLANELQGTSLADLWVQAAITVDNEEVFESDGEENATPAEGATTEETIATTQNLLGPITSAPSIPPPSRSNRPSIPATPRFSFNDPRRPSLAMAGSRRPSTAANLPVIFAHTGVRTPPMLSSPGPVESSLPPNEALTSIAESRPVSTTVENLVMEQKAPSLWTQLPLMIILQYGLLALHSTIHDQVFYLYLVSQYRSGGLGLTPAHFSQLIAMMCLVQIVFQFYLYPNIGPPRGRFSHLAMFRIGSALCIPAYLTVTLYRAFASDGEGNSSFVMIALAISTAIRYCGGTFAYTSVAILLNYMAPLPIVGMANGLAQSIVSLARFLGPIIGGYLWVTSVEGDPSGYSLGFVVCSVVCALAILQSFMIR